MIDGVDKVEGDLLGDRSLAPSQVVHVSLGQGKLLRQLMLKSCEPRTRIVLSQEVIMKNLSWGEHSNGHRSRPGACQLH